LVTSPRVYFAAGRNQRRIAVRLVIDDENLVTIGEQPLRQMDADEAGAARDQNFHAFASSGILYFYEN
jgi:hypothetical protein